MNSNQIQQLLNDGAREIRFLRQRNEVLQAKAEVVDTFRLALTAHMSSSCGVLGECVAWRMEQAAEILGKQDEVAAKCASECGERVSA